MYINTAMTETGIKQSRFYTSPFFWLGMLVICAFLTTIVLLAKPISGLYRQYTLSQTYDQVIAYDKENNCEDLYQFLLPSSKNEVMQDDFVKECQEDKLPRSVEYNIHSITVEGDEGVVDRTRIGCYSARCAGKSRVENRVKKQYYYVNGKWYFPYDNNIYCDRAKPYPMEEEFNRAISLIVQRSQQSEYDYYAKEIQKIRNCLDIQYADSEAEMAGAEGLFAFNQESTNDRLEIYVSPSYQVKDDILTAALLIHEIGHAFMHASTLENNISCYENEANAFTSQYTFIGFMLNEEERTSLKERYGKSEGVSDLLDTMLAINKYPGEYYKDRALEFVKDTPYYQRQCDD